MKNVSSGDLGDVKVAAVFVDVNKDEVFSEAVDYTVGIGDSPLRPGYAKTAFLYASVGYRSDLVAARFPDLVAEVSVNGHFYRRVTVSKEYVGVDWGR